MELELKREINSEGGCMGALYLDGTFEAYTLEPPDGMADPRGFTAVAPATYRIELNYSPRFLRVMPQLMGVKGRSGIRIHWGNYERCTDGCVLVGEERDPSDEIWNSRTAFDRLYEKLKAAVERGEDIELRILPAPVSAQEA